MTRRAHNPEPNLSWTARLCPQLNTVWHGRWNAGFIEPARYLYDHELVLVTDGKCVVQVAERRHELKAGSYLIVPPDTYHVSTTQHGVHRFCIHFDWEYSQPQPAHPLFRYAPERPEPSSVRECPAYVPQGDFVGSFALVPEIRPLLETLYHRSRLGRRIEQALARATLLEILVLLLAPRGGDTRAHDLGREHAYAVRDLLDRDSNAGIQELLTSFGYSYPHLCRLFHATFGLTPGAYRNALRLERAKSLLAHSSLAIKEIAYQAGFKDPGYFTRQFRKQNKISPREARLSKLAAKEHKEPKGPEGTE